MLEIDKKSLEKMLDDILTDIAVEVFNKSQENIRKFNAIDTGFLWRSGYVRIDKLLEKEVGYTAPYAIFVEFGTEPHWLPHKPIFEWVRRKLRITNEKKASQVAWAIVHKIAREGTKPRPFLRRAIEEVREKLKSSKIELEFG